MNISEAQTIENDLAEEAEILPTEDAVVGKTMEAEEEISLSAEPIFHLGQFTVTNSLINTWLAALIIIVLAILVGKKIALVPRGIVNWFEAILEEALKMADSVTGSREKTLKFFPLVFALFLFILVNNWLGLLPGIGSIGYIVGRAGENIFVPYLRGGTADLNTTLALALVSLILTHIIGVITTGAWRYLNKFINFNTLIEIPKKILKEPTIILINPIKFFVGLVEVVGEVAKIASLSFRLFGNIFAGEVLLMSITLLFAYIAPIPFYFLEIIVGLVQALVFSILILVFLTIATTKEEH